MQIDQLTRLWIPPDYVQSVKVSYGGTPVLEVEGDIALSADPAGQLLLRARGSGIDSRPGRGQQGPQVRAVLADRPRLLARPSSWPRGCSRGRTASSAARGPATTRSTAPTTTRSGRAHGRRPLLVREALPGGLPVGPELADDPPEARELPPRLRRLPAPTPGAWPHRRRAPARRCRHRPPPRQDRIGAEQPGGRSSCGRRRARSRLCAALHAGPGVAARAARLGHPAGAREYARIVRAEQGAAPPRLEASSARRRCARSCRR